MNATLKTSLTVLGIDFDAESNFTFDIKVWQERHPYGMGYASEDMGEITNIEPLPFYLVNLTEAVNSYVATRFASRLSMLQCVELVNRLTSKIESRVEKANPLALVDEDEFIDAAANFSE